MIPDISDIIRQVVLKTSKELSLYIHFEHGHPLEVINTLLKYNVSRELSNKKYPLIALFHDFDVERKDVSIFGTCSLNLIIANITSQKYNSAERLENSFLPVLYPIYEEFINQISRSKSIRCPNSEVQHIKIDRMFWGKDGLGTLTGNVFNDFIDAIEIKNLTIQIKNSLCQAT